MIKSLKKNWVFSIQGEILYIQIVYDSLIIIKPTRAESKRAFSTVGLFCTKIRSQLGPKVLISYVSYVHIF